MFSRFLLVAPLLVLVACAPQGEGQTSATQTVQTQTVQPQTKQPQAQPTSPPANQRDSRSGLAFIARTALPREGQRTLTLIANGGPFRYQKDGVTFGNRERILPRQASGYYREYTVPTPGAADRGARRIVCGQSSVKNAVNNAAECYYTADHYANFKRIAP
ncbi:ribonuclease domain-containing protein [Deinococcus sp.]|uniref:ribonuclease domain-containing protein n=1 Tax=Deinococcus sp. TaxID=47478 RepID=UPI003B5BB85E